MTEQQAQIILSWGIDPDAADAVEDANILLADWPWPMNPITDEDRDAVAALMREKEAN